ncbi:MAG: hypothetical protein J6S23_07720 [Clostridia bacterium]|nr:hypothetical protein [Clostridia bacterium]
MKKVQNSGKSNRAQNELLEHYENRTKSFDNSSAYTEQRAREIASRATAQKLRREYTPEANVRLDTMVLLDRIDGARYKKDKNKMNTNKNDIKAKLEREAARSNPKSMGAEKKSNPKKQSESTSSKIKEVAKAAAKTWVPLEERHSETIIEGKKTKLPSGVILAIVVITISLLLIVSSIVLLGSAKNEKNALKNEIAALDFEISELQADLNKKNENADIEIFAEEQLGMIKQEHVKAEYIKSNKTDGILKLDAEKISFKSLLQWIFQQFK